VQQKKLKHLPKTKFEENARRAKHDSVEIEDSAESGPVEPEEEAPKKTANAKKGKSSSPKEVSALDEAMEIDLNEAPEPAVDVKPKPILSSPSKSKRVIVDEDDDEEVSGETKDVQVVPKKPISNKKNTVPERKSPKNNEKNSKKTKEETTKKSAPPKKERERLKTRTEVEVARQVSDSEEEPGSGEEFEVEKIIGHRYEKVSWHN
jgi:hypothetical protein